MATLVELAADGWFTKFDPVLRPDQQELRLLYALPRGQSWLESSLPALETVFEKEESPAEQVDALLATFCAGELLIHTRQFHVLQHVDAGIWELKTPDVRMFGWFPMKDCFICSNAEDATHIKRHGLYVGFRDEAIRERSKLPLYASKYISGDDPNAVVSNCR